MSTRICMTVTIGILLILMVGIVSAEVTFTADPLEFVRPESGQTETFTLSVCGATDYQIYYTPSPTPYIERPRSPTYVRSNVLNAIEPNNIIRVKNVSGECHTFEFRTTEETTPAEYWFILSEKEGQYYAPFERQIRLNITILDPLVFKAEEEAARIAEEKAEEAAKVAALEKKIAEQEEKIAMLQVTAAPTETPTPETIPITTEPAAPQETETIGELAGITIPPTYAPSETSHVSEYEERIAALETQNAELQRQQEEQRGFIDQILAFLGLI